MIHAMISCILKCVLKACRLSIRDNGESSVFLNVMRHLSFDMCISIADYLRSFGVSLVAWNLESVSSRKLDEEIHWIPFIINTGRWKERGRTTMLNIFGLFRFQGINLEESLSACLLIALFEYF
ncbi:hypothetical protein ANTQUA_LOCUS1746 [Anthophora quadrimaculata]